MSMHGHRDDAQFHPFISQEISISCINKVLLLLKLSNCQVLCCFHIHEVSGCAVVSKGWKILSNWAPCQKDGQSTFVVLRILTRTVTWKGDVLCVHDLYPYKCPFKYTYISSIYIASLTSFLSDMTREEMSEIKGFWTLTGNQFTAY